MKASGVQRFYLEGRAQVDFCRDEEDDAVCVWGSLLQTEAGWCKNGRKGAPLRQRLQGLQSARSEEEVVEREGLQKTSTTCVRLALSLRGRRDSDTKGPIAMAKNVSQAVGGAAGMPASLSFKLGRGWHPETCTSRQVLSISVPRILFLSLCSTPSCMHGWMHACGVARCGEMAPGRRRPEP
eukprot:350306-Chlamydomonas_euryale.AAC.4